MTGVPGAPGAPAGPGPCPQEAGGRQEGPGGRQEEAGDSLQAPGGHRHEEVDGQEVRAGGPRREAVRRWGGLLAQGRACPGPWVGEGWRVSEGNTYLWAVEKWVSSPSFLLKTRLHREQGKPSVE